MATHLSTPTRRTNFILTERQYNFLLTESARTGLTMSELVRRAVDSTYRPGRLPLVRGFEFTIGLFKRPNASTIGRSNGRRLFEL
jgi:hypothetical protein